MQPFTFYDDLTIAEMTVGMLFEIGAIHVRPDEPYTFTSGLKSPVYIDCRKIISFPRVRSALIDFAVSKVVRDAGFESLDAVAGGETAGIPFAAWIADRLNLPMNYIRKKPKGFGRDAQIEGDQIAGKRVLLVEDLTTDGGSKIKFCEAMRAAGAEVGHTIVIFYYDIFPSTRPKLEEAGLKLLNLATWRDVLRVSREAGHFDEETLSTIEDFLNDPLPWSKRHGGSADMSI